MEEEDDEEDDVNDEDIKFADAEHLKSQGVPDKIVEEDDDEEENAERKLWLPNVRPLQPGEKLEYDSSAYDMIHFVTVEWPCLSFDLLPDSIGPFRTKFPHTMYAVAGTQAEKNHENKIILMKFSELHKTKHDDDEDSGIDLDDDDMDDDPVLDSKSMNFPHGSINRIRAMPQNPNIIASISSSATVDIHDVKHHLSALDKTPSIRLKPPKSLFSFKHTTEGWALDWSSKAEGRLVSGDCDSKIYWWEPLEGGKWNVNQSTPYAGHTASVEDLQWSPSEPDVFASCSVDKTIKLWDGRKGRSPVTSIDAHESDVNVISWNRKRAYLLLSGADDGNFKVWDLRKFKPQFSFSWHKQAITSVEWNPNEASELAVASEDHSVSIWDLKLLLERTSVDGNEIPPQLLFVHQGQEYIKEVHWHKQIPGALVTTALSGFNIFKPSISLIK
eukprot:TRINITY_DN1679_c0_g1_i1.p1 TRINITY_DN1679_c0_g1~~TRINITY_DN1679_c0_g1_i1.p1  ORF type:complete len:444 (+),score=118.20 TRINITY_DN1679_c0_g1_i1:287-1618(+)